jgi:hypothetical protein
VKSLKHETFKMMIIMKQDVLYKVKAITAECKLKLEVTSDKKNERNQTATTVTPVNDIAVNKS